MKAGEDDLQYRNSQPLVTQRTAGHFLPTLPVLHRSIE